VIIGRYITREIAKPLFLGSILLAVVFAGYRSAANLTDAASGLLQPNIAIKLIFLETLVALEVLLPTALYLSVVVGLGRLHGDSEMIALQATGMGESAVLATVLRFSMVVALVVAILSIAVRPWAYQTSHALEARSVAETDITSLHAERFYPLPPTQNVLFAEEIDDKQHYMKKVFVQGDRGDHSMVIYAQEAYQMPSKRGSQRSMKFVDGHAYDLGRYDARDRHLRFRSLTIFLEESPEVDVQQNRKAESTATLLGSTKPKDIAELQWRLSTPIATILLALLGVPLSRTSPRQRRQGGILIAILIYALFFNLTGVAQTWVEQGRVGKIPGLWWPYTLPAGLLLLLLWRPTLTWRRKRR